ncbi:MAG: hypothetical protein DWQ05_20500 [Calditrichaeota bacterium]|nr:MAG: hypothetical protein DWQ05_20500 [Calditrichota bacterium]
MTSDQFTIAKNKEQRLIERLLKKVHATYGKDPFIIIAENGLSVSLGASDDFLQCNEWSFSRFLPENSTIEINRRQLDYFWNEMYPGCPQDLKYRYACWRELWHFWIYQRFASVHSLLQHQGNLYIASFINQPKACQNYFSHYLAGIATGLISRPAQEPTFRHAGNPLV